MTNHSYVLVLVSLSVEAEIRLAYQVTLISSSGNLDIFNLLLFGPTYLARNTMDL